MNRTAQANQICGLLSEFGIVIPQGIRSVMQQISEILEDGENALPGTFCHLIARLDDNLKKMDRQLDEMEKEINLWPRQNEASRKLAEMPGIWPITAIAIIATLGKAQEFKVAGNSQHG